MAGIQNIGSVNEFLRSSLQNPEAASAALEDTKRRMDALEATKKEETNRNADSVRALLQAIVDVKAIERTLLADVYEVSLKEEQQKLDVTKQQAALAAAEKQDMLNVLQEIEVARKRNEAEKLEIEALIKKEFKSTRATYELYRNITGIDFNQEGGPEKCEGYAALGKDTKPFSLSSSELSPFFIANYLWDLLDEESKTELL